jgi:hypothetical protein
MLKSENFLDASFADRARGRKGFDVRIFPRKLDSKFSSDPMDDLASINFYEASPCRSKPRNVPQPVNRAS